MPAKKKTKRQTKSKTGAGKKTRLITKNLAAKRQTAKKQLSKKKVAQKKGAVKTKAVAKKTLGAKTASPLRRQATRKGQTKDVTSLREGLDAGSGQLSGDLQGLSNVPGADSESVDELLEEGNAFEADVVTGVENAEDADEGEVRTHEVPEDDVPDEYLDKE